MSREPWWPSPNDTESDPINLRGGKKRLRYREGDNLPHTYPLTLSRFRDRTPWKAIDVSHGFFWVTFLIPTFISQVYTNISIRHKENNGLWHGNDGFLRFQGLLKCSKKVYRVCSVHYPECNRSMNGAKVVFRLGEGPSLPRQSNFRFHFDPSRLRFHPSRLRSHPCPWRDFDSICSGRGRTRARRMRLLRSSPPRCQLLSKPRSAMS
jgi:hypothetical protein